MKFAITRHDGRSDAQVLIDLVSKNEPGTVFSHEDLAKVLEEGADRKFDTERVRGAVYRSRNRMLKELSRTLSSVRGIGYKVALATEHRSIAIGYKNGAVAKLNRGLTTLRNVHWEEMDDNSRRAHEGTLLVMESQSMAIMHTHKRVQRIEDILGRISGERFDDDDGPPPVPALT